MSRVLVVDLMNQLFNIFHVNEKNIALRFATDINKLLQETCATKVILATDFGKSTYRLKLHPGYKQDREKRRREQTAEDKRKLEKFYKDAQNFQDNVARMFGFESIKHYGIEADDVCAFLVNHTDLENNQIMQVTTDKDWSQLLRKNVVQRSMYFKTKVNGNELPAKVWLNRKRFVDCYGIEPYQLADVKALAGDVSDSIYSVDGLGDKTALNLVKQYGSISEVEKNLDSIHSDVARVPKKAVENLKSNFEQVYFNYKLVNLNYTEEVKNEIFSKDVQENLNSVIGNFSVRNSVDRDAIYDWLFEQGQVNLLGKFDSWIKPFEGEF